MKKEAKLKEIHYPNGSYYDIVWNPEKESLFDFMEEYSAVFEIKHILKEINDSGQFVYRLIIQ